MIASSASKLSRLVQTDEPGAAVTETDASAVLLSSADIGVDLTRDESRRRCLLCGDDRISELVPSLLEDGMVCRDLHACYVRCMDAQNAKPAEVTCPGSDEPIVI